MRGRSCAFPVSLKFLKFVGLNPFILWVLEALACSPFKLSAVILFREHSMQWRISCSCPLLQSNYCLGGKSPYFQARQSVRKLERAERPVYVGNTFYL